MPEIAVILDIDDYANAAQKPKFKQLGGYYELEAPCQTCNKSLTQGFVFGKAQLSDGRDWYESGQSFSKGGEFQYRTQSLRWLFENYTLWQRGDTICACSAACAQAREKEFRGEQATVQAAAAPTNKECYMCGKGGADKRCARCKNQWYCSRECQKDAWKTHSKECSPGSTGSAAKPDVAAPKQPAPTKRPAPTKKQEKKAAPSSKKAAPSSPSEKSWMCGTCKTSRPQSLYSSAQLKKKGKRKCSKCVAQAVSLD